MAKYVSLIKLKNLSKVGEPVDEPVELVEPPITCNLIITIFYRDEKNFKEHFIVCC